MVWRLCSVASSCTSVVIHDDAKRFEVQSVLVRQHVRLTALSSNPKQTNSSVEIEA
jgi:hypothetical protein